MVGCVAFFHLQRTFVCLELYRCKFSVVSQINVEEEVFGTKAPLIMSYHTDDGYDIRTTLDVFCCFESLPTPST